MSIMGGNPVTAGAAGPAFSTNELPFPFVAAENHDRVVVNASFLDGIENLTDAKVHLANHVGTCPSTFLGLQTHTPNSMANMKGCPVPIMLSWFKLGSAKVGLRSTWP